MAGWLGSRDDRYGGGSGGPGPARWGSRPEAAGVQWRRWSGNPGTRRESHSGEQDGAAKEEEAVIT